MEKIYVIFDGDGQIVAFYSSPQAAVQTEEIATSDERYKAYFDTLSAQMQPWFPTPE
jgi:hypothetical protein